LLSIQTRLETLKNENVVMQRKVATVRDRDGGKEEGIKRKGVMETEGSGLGSGGSREKTMVFLHARARTHAHTHIHTYLHSFMHTFIHICIHIYAY
jgi:hypothetical protein